MPRWSTNESMYLRKLWMTEHTLAEIVALLGGTRSLQSVRSKLHSMKVICSKRVHGAPRVSAAGPVPASVMEERARRAKLRPYDLTAAFCGDPLPGYSALDRRKAA